MDMHTKIWLKAMKIANKYCGCHQIAERSFFFHGYQFPLCTRCTGIAVGYFGAFLMAIFQLTIPIWICLLFIFPLIIDGGLQFLFSIMSNNIRRFITGLFFGIGSIQLIVNMLIFIKQFCLDI